MGNIVAIVGRPNVGKSTLFNRLIGSKKAIVNETSGVTRDRHYGKCEWNGRKFSVIDTGGYVINSDDIFENEIRKQATLAINEADAVLFLVDLYNGITDLDMFLAEFLRKAKKPVFLVVNKVDEPVRSYEASEFYSLGLGEIHCISAANGSGTGDLLDVVVASFKKEDENDDFEEDLPKLAIIGRPNVGKSSLLNALMEEDRNIVTDIAGTTRDTIHSRFSKFGHDFYLIDTAGIRKKNRVVEDVEFYSVMRSIRAIEYADVCLFMIDATQGIESQDMNIFKIIQKNSKGMVILINKWDLVEKDQNSMKQYTKIIHEKIAPFTDVPILFISALSKQRILKSIEMAMEVFENRKRKIPTSKLNEVMLPLVESYPPPIVKGKEVKIKFVVQIPTHAPSFVFFCSLPQYVKGSYKRYVENRIRENFKFTGAPIKIFFRQK